MSTYLDAMTDDELLEAASLAVGYAIHHAANHDAREANKNIKSLVDIVSHVYQRSEGAPDGAVIN